MKRTVEITTPIPSAESVAERLGISKARLQAIRNIVDGQLREKRGGKRTPLRRHYSSTAQTAKK